MIDISHAVLESLACPGRALDALKQRHSIDGPLRAGQGFHTFMRRYLEHLLKASVDIDIDAASSIWASIAPTLTPGTEAFVGQAPFEFAASTSFGFLLGADGVAIEEPAFLPLGSAARFRWTCDLKWTGDAMPARPTSEVPPGLLRHVVDWKMLWSIESSAAPAAHRQLKRYAAAEVVAADAAGLEARPVMGWLVFPRRGQWESATWWPDELRSFWKEYVVAPAGALLSSSMVDERVVGIHCADCLMLAGCDAALRYPYIVPELQTLSDEELLTVLAIADAIRQDAHDNLRQRMALSGPKTITAGGVQAKMTATKTAIWQPAIVRRELRACGLSEEQVDAAFGVTLDGISRALAAAQYKHKAKGGVAAKAREIRDLMPIDHGQTIKVSRVKHERAKQQDEDKDDVDEDFS